MDESKLAQSDAKSNDLSRGRTQTALIQAVRLAFLLVILIITLVFQAAQPEFTSVDVLYPVYLLLAASFAVNILYLFFFDQALRLVWPTAGLFVFDSLFVTAIIYFTGISQSIFLFFYLINIILCGFVFLRRGAMALALWTAVLYSFLIIVSNENRSEAFYLAFSLNLLAFFAVAVLSGYLSEQLTFTGRELKERRRDLADLTDLNNLIVENVATGLITVTQEGMIVRANRAASETLDREKDLVGLNITTLFPDLLVRVQNVLLVDRHAHRTHFDVGYQNARQEQLILEMIVSPLHRSASEEISGDNDGYILIFQDLTKVRRLEFAVRQSEKLAAVGQLAAGIAHEIRNPLASISGSIQLLRSMLVGESSEEKMKLMTIVLREIDRLNSLITEFLDFVRPDAQELVPLHLHDLLKEVTDMVRVNTALRSDVVQELDFQAGQSIAGQFDKLKQAFLNIIINAYQAMEKVAAPKLSISTRDRAGRVVVCIRDSGTGMDERNLKRIFEPFHTTKAKGTGLGLAVTHKILENHGASVFVESKIGVGTEFTLEFPAYLTRQESAGESPLKKANG